VSPARKFLPTKEDIFMKILNAVAATLALTLGACASMDHDKDFAFSEDLETVTAVVEAINTKTRVVTLRGEGGKVIVFEASKEVVNLPQVKVGDQVVVKYYKALAAQLKPKGSTASSDVLYDGAAARAEAGQHPGMFAASTVSADVRIEAIDLKTNTVSFIGPAGVLRETQVVKPEMQELLKTLKVGDIVELSYFEGLAASVEPVSK
jgi:hypothetical protein